MLKERQREREEDGRKDGTKVKGIKKRAIIVKHTLIFSSLPLIGQNVLLSYTHTHTIFIMYNDQ